MSEQAKQQIAQLRSFRGRKGAMDALMQMGDEAVPDLVEALANRMENVRWAARSVLVMIGGEAVTARLVEALEDPRRADLAAEALSEITGRTLGADRQAWAQFLSGAAAPSEAAREAPAAPAEAAPAEPLSDEALIEAAIAGTDVQAKTRSGGAVLTVPLEGGRKQRVTVSFASKDSEGEPLVVIYTECGPAEAKNFEWALRQNLRMAFGAIAIRDRDDEPIFVMVNTHLRAAATPDEVRKSVLLLARKGDKLEKALTEGDAR